MHILNLACLKDCVVIFRCISVPVLGLRFFDTVINIFLWKSQSLNMHEEKFWSGCLSFQYLSLTLNGDHIVHRLFLYYCREESF